MNDAETQERENYNHHAKNQVAHMSVRLLGGGGGILHVMLLNLNDA